MLVGGDGVCFLFKWLFVVVVGIEMMMVIIRCMLYLLGIGDLSLCWVVGILLMVYVIVFFFFIVF